MTLESVRMMMNCSFFILKNCNDINYFYLIDDFYNRSSLSHIHFGFVLFNFILNLYTDR